jgi:hypothetical protein
VCCWKPKAGGCARAKSRTLAPGLRRGLQSRGPRAWFPCFTAPHPGGRGCMRTDVRGGREAQAADEAGAEVRHDVAVEVGHAQHVKAGRVSHLPCGGGERLLSDQEMSWRQAQWLLAGCVQAVSVFGPPFAWT